LHEPDDSQLLKIQEEFSLHELAIEDAQHAHQRLKIQAYNNSLFIVLKMAHLQADQVVFGETHLFVGPNFLVSVRHGASSSYVQVLQRCEDGTKNLPKGPGNLALVANNQNEVVKRLAG
jgi:magnesium transporter